jgi:hypothetical protein
LSEPPKAFAPKTVTVVWDGSGSVRVYADTRELTMVRDVVVDDDGRPNITFRRPETEAEGLLLDEETRQLRDSGFAAIRRS